MFLEELVGAVRLEDDRMECKARLDRQKPQGWLKTICGFANAEGGTLFLGVEDKTGKLLGFERREADNERNYLNNQINEHISPRPQIKISFLRYEVHEKERFILRVDINESVYKPVILKFDGVPSIYMRRQGFTNGASYEEILEMSRNSPSLRYDLLPTEEPFVREHFQDLLSFCKERNDGEEHLTDKALASMGFFDENGFLANGALFFMDGYAGERTEVHCSVFSGFTKGSERIVSLNKCKGNLVQSLRFMLDYVRQRMNRSIVKLADSRENIDAFPERALFEGIVNAIAHRDYALEGTQIQVDMFRDRLEITSPGGFFQRQKIRKTYDLSSIISKRRNSLICDVLVRCNAMEASGTGFEKIEEDYRKADERHKPYICTESDHFTLVLPDLTYQEGVRDGHLPTLEVIPVENGTKHDRKVLEYCYDTAHTAKEIAEFLGLSNSTYLRKNIIDNLVRTDCLREEVYAGKKHYKTVRESVREI